jgi:protein-L-isoaspartate(D-aspartate) O-methyltransferase
VSMRVRSFLIVFITAASFFQAGCTGADDNIQAGEKYSARRAEMVSLQLKARGISDTLVLAAMSRIERHRFVPGPYRHMAYYDGPLPIGHGQTISQPYIVALMTELLQVDSTDKVFEVGTGSGYQAAVLAEIVDQVFTVEIVEPLAKSADSLLKALGYDNITVRAGDGYAGWIEEAPFDAIIVTAAPPEIPPPLIEQLAEGGRMVIPVGDYYQELLLVEKKKGEVIEKSVIPVRFVPMIGKAQEKK